MPDSALKHFKRLVGIWETKATHPALPGVVVNGKTVIEWMEGGKFLLIRAHHDHPDFPDSLSILGFMDQDRVNPGAEAETAESDAGSLRMHYFDSRGVFRVYAANISEESWGLEREASGFSQRFTGTFRVGDRVIAGRWQAREDDVNWVDDLEITYQRTLPSDP